MKQFNSKGQIFSFDLMLALTVFIGLLVFWVLFTDFSVQRINLIESQKDIAFEGKNISDSLIYFSGAPQNWENYSIEDINSIGLVSGRNELNEYKWNAFLDLNSDYEISKRLAGAYKSDLFVELQDLNGFSFGSFGLTPDVNSTVLVYFNPVKFRNRNSLLIVKVFK